MSASEQIAIGCVGMTHLGLVHAVAFAEKGFNLICYDDNKTLIAQLQKHHLPVNEPQLTDLVSQCSERLQFTDDLTQLTRCDLVFIACDVPTDDQGTSNLNVIDQLIDKVSPQLSDAATLVVLSQVPPGYTRQIKLPKNQLFYQVETLVFGRAVERALFPERYIIGANDPSLELPSAYLKLLSTFHCPVLKMRYESAELAKISINMFLVSTVSTTNTIAEICEHIGADWNEIAPALRLDNLERDLNTIIKLGRSNSTDVGVVDAWLHNSLHRRDWVLRCLQMNVLDHIKNPKICILGLAYKPDTHSIKNSPSIALINQLKNYQIIVHDPVVDGKKIANITQQIDSMKAIEGADVVIIMTPWAEYQKLTIDLLQQHMHGNTIIDPHRVLKINEDERESVNYFTLGQHAMKTKEKELNYA